MIRFAVWKAVQVTPQHAGWERVDDHAFVFMGGAIEHLAQVRAANPGVPPEWFRVWPVSEDSK